MAMATRLTLEPCEHKFEVGCVLTALPICCACADKRPEAPAYPVYVDGEGMKMQGKRWSRYCWRCRDFWNNNTSQTPSMNPVMEPWIPPQRAVPPVNENPPGRPHHLNPQAQSFQSAALAPTQYAIPDQPITQGHWRDGHALQVSPIPIAQRANAHSSSHNPHSHPPVVSLPQPPRPQTFPLGTREDVEQEDYQSPVGLMFQRAYDRFSRAEEIRQETAAAFGIPVNIIRTMDPISQQAAYANSRMYPQHNTGHIGVGPPLYPGSAIQLGYRTSDLPGAPASFAPFAPFVHTNSGNAPEDGEAGSENGENAIDRQGNRPSPLSNTELTVNIACKMCMEQKIDTLIEPCMHLAMCRWCSDVWQEHARRARTRDPATRHAWKCPVCRRAIQQVRRVYFLF